MLSAAPWASLTLPSCSPNYPRASRIGWTLARYCPFLKSPLKIIGNPNRPNFFYEKVFRKGEDIDFHDELLQSIACGFKKSTVEYPLAILYLPLKWCGFAYKYFESHLAQQQYYRSNAASLPENRLFAQYHAPQTSTMKDQILTELASPTSKVSWVIFATIAMGMGVDIPFMWDPRILCESTFKRLVEQEEMENYQLLYFITTIVILLRIEKGWLMILELSVN